ncbi:MAG: hypothetical protein NVSMB67_30190 [Flavisolibacter sp.]
MIMQLKTIGGLGVENHIRTEGCFEVRYYDSKHFTSLYEAYEFYKSLDYPASLYDTTINRICLEMKVFREFDNLF